MYVYVSEALLYLCFAVLTGGLISHLLSTRLMPGVEIPHWLLPSAVLGIAFFSLFPIIRIVLYFYEDIGFWITVQSVMTSFTEGQAYLLTLFLSFLLVAMLSFYYILNHRHFLYMSALLTLGLIFTFGWASHMNSLYGWPGFWTHSAHFLAMSIWVGTLMMTGWFAQRQGDWSIFLRWFNPVAITCVLVIIGSGLVMMNYIVPEYYNSWMLSYGQALLIKHLLVVPLLVYGFINGFWMKRRLRDNPRFQPASWVRTEGLIILSIFICTGVLGQQSPPHDVTATLNETDPSALFLTFYKGNFNPETSLQWIASADSIGLATLACLLLALILWSFYKGKRAILTFPLVLLFVVIGYFSLMFGLE